MKFFVTYTYQVFVLNHRYKVYVLKVLEKLLCRVPWWYLFFTLVYSALLYEIELVH